VKLRDLIAHAYGDIDEAKLYEAGTAGTAEIEGFLLEIAAWLGLTGETG